MNKSKNTLNYEDYCRIIKMVSKWPNWKKELANETLLVSKHSYKIPIYYDNGEEKQLKKV